MRIMLRHLSLGQMLCDSHTLPKRWQSRLVRTSNGNTAARLLARRGPEYWTCSRPSRSRELCLFAPRGNGPLNQRLNEDDADFPEIILFIATRSRPRSLPGCEYPEDLVQTQVLEVFSFSCLIENRTQQA